jgi:hypothetical protein
MSTKLNMNHIVVGEDGRVAIGDEQLAAIENQNINPSAGGWDIYQDPWLNDFMCKGGGTDFFCIFGATLNEYNCKGTVNTRCGNDWMCGIQKIGSVTTAFHAKVRPTQQRARIHMHQDVPAPATRSRELARNTEA